MRPRGAVAAFFDLDKTVIATSSTLAFSRPFFAEGLLNRRAVIASGYAQLVFYLTSADHDQVEALRRHVTTMCAGWDVGQVREIVAETLHEVVTPLVFAEAAALIAHHHELGHQVVLISASGRELVEPIGEMLGVDHVRASEMSVTDGHYTGELAHYCHGEVKADAMRDLAGTHGYDLDASYAYSDSITDIPMLSAVGHPAVVNPDRHLRRHATENGWAVLSFNHPIPLIRRVPRRARHMGVALSVGAATAAASMVALRAFRGERVG